MTSKKFNFELATPVAGQATRAGATDVAATCKSVLLACGAAAARGTSFWEGVGDGTTL